MKKIRVFIIDDHQLIIDGIIAMFQDSSDIDFVGFSNDGVNAKEQLSKTIDKIDLVITDVGLPDISGIEICNFIKTNFENKKVLMMSMYQSNSIVIEALNVDADGYILKTAGYDDFKKAIYRVMDGSSYYSESIYPIIYNEYKKEKEKKQFYEQLTKREIEILKLIIQEFTSTEIGDLLCISKKTVDNHRQNLLSKTQSKSTIGLVKFALKTGITND